MIHINKSEERVDLVDAKGRVQERNISRSEAGAYPDLHLQIVIVVVFDTLGRMLVQKRAQTKRVNPGDVDHICGGVMTGETPVEAAFREALEETGIQLFNLTIVTEGVNKYDRYRYLLVGESNEIPGEVDPTEVEWVRFIHPDELKAGLNANEMTFVDEFFEDTELALSNLKKALEL